MSKGKGGSRKVFSFSSKDVEVFVIARSVKACISILRTHNHVGVNENAISETDRKWREASDAVNYFSQEKGS